MDPSSPEGQQLEARKAQSFKTYKMYSDSLKSFVSEVGSQSELVNRLQTATADDRVIPKSPTSPTYGLYDSKSGQHVSSP
jgi:hypothetical protein